MSILDDAIREHLELKRAHGADDSELKRLEDEAFGPPGRPEEPDPMAEAPTEFLSAEVPEGTEAAGEESVGRRINIADLQEPPPPEPAPLTPAEDAAQAAAPAEEESTLAEPEPALAEEDRSEVAEEHQAIAEQPTELFDVEADLGAADAAAPSPSDEEIVEAELSEPKLAPAEPATEIHASRSAAAAAPAEEDEEDEEFWSEQRLSDELDQALEAPLTEEHEIPSPADEPEVPRPAADPAAVYEDADAGDEEREQPRGDRDPDAGHEDVLEDTPDFLEGAPEDDELWFEQKPPKDFDFDD
ncbi:MAG: hypothetical protein ACJ76D_14105 [Solirubrobacterales bacterium]